MLNPDLEPWIHGIAGLWPNSNIFIITNGTQLKNQPDLFDILKHYQGRVRIDIHRHNPGHWETLQQDVETFYQDGYEKYTIDHAATPKTGTCQFQDSSKSTWQQESTHELIWQDPLYDIVYRDQSDIVVRLSHSNRFDNVALVFDPHENNLKLPYLNDADQAVRACSSKWSHHLSRGHLYKCRMTAVLPEFIKQFPVHMTQEQKMIVQNSQGLRVDCTDGDLQTFIANLVNCESVEQCRLCPTSFDIETFSAGTKKIRIKKLVN